MSKSKIPLQQRTNNTIRNAVTTLIKHISIIFIFVALGVIALLYLGPEITLATQIVFRLAVPSVVLAVSITILYELWIKNGRQTAFEETDYQERLLTYSAKSEGLSYEIMQEFLDKEHDRRYKVEYDRLTRIIDREQVLLSKLEETSDPKLRHKFKIWKVKKRMMLSINARNTIKVFMPYEKSEEFDYLRYNIQDIVYKEYSPSDTTKHLAKARAKKYMFAYTFAILGFNLLSIGGAMGNIWVAIIMTVLAAVSLMYAVVSGFSVGYYNIKTINTGVYNTAISFIDQAVAYCKKCGKDLYYKGETEFRVITSKPVETSIESEPAIEEVVKIPEDIFTKAAIEVTDN